MAGADNDAGPSATSECDTRSGLVCRLHFRPQRNGSGLLPEPSRPEPLSGGPVGPAAAEAGAGAGGSGNHPGVSTPVTPSSVPSSSSAPTTDYESFQSHQEELFEMQRKQLERLKGVTTASGASDGAVGGSRHPGTGSGVSSTAPTPRSAVPSGSSHSTLDPASVEFAVSALLSTTEVSGILNSLVSSPSVTTAASLGDGAGSTVTAAAQARLAVAAANGPSTDAARAASEGDVLRTTPKQQPGGQVAPDAGAEADSHVMAALPPVELGNKLPASLTDLRYSILEQNGNEGNKARHELSSSNLGRVKLEPDGALPMDVT